MDYVKKEYTNQEIRILEESGLDPHYKYRIPEAICLTNPSKQTLEFSRRSLVFNYNNQFHNVKQVTHQGFESCNATSPLATYTNGSDTVTLGKQLGHFYFICGYPGHCQAGQKIDILVAPATSNLSPAASPSSASSLYFSNLSWTLGVLGFYLLGFAY